MAKRTLAGEKPRRLEDEHLFNLSQKLGSVGNLEKLAYRGLTLEHHQVESALKNHPSDIQTAAYEILSAWSKDYENRVQAYSNLKAALQECDLVFLTCLLEESEGNITPSASPLAGLLDSHIQRLSERFTDVGILKQLAYRGFKMESHDIQSAISNNPSDIQSAAHDVLRKWQLTQGNREEAMDNLLTALEQSNLKSFAEELKQWMMKHNSLAPMTEERKYQSLTVKTRRLLNENNFGLHV